MAQPPKQLEQILGDESRVSLVREVWEFLGMTKKWWLLPILLVLGGLGMLVMVSGTAAAPFIYTLF